MTRSERVAGWGLAICMLSVAVAMMVRAPYFVQWLVLVPGYVLGAFIGHWRHSTMERREQVWRTLRHLADYRKPLYDVDPDTPWAS